MYPKCFAPWSLDCPPLLRIADEKEPVYGPDDKLEVLTHRRSLNENLSSMLKDVQNGNFKDLERTIMAMHGDVAGIDTYLSKTIEAKYYAQDRPPESTAAVKALAVPELLENVLSYLKAADLMQCYAVNRTFRDVIERSDVLQMLLFLKPDPNGEANLFPFESRYIFCTGAQRNFQQISFKARPGLGTALPSIGSRWKKMLISQPPMRHTYYGLYCQIPGAGAPCHDGYGNKDGQIVGDFQLELQSDDGLTIGDLYEAAKAMLEKWSGCTEYTFAPGGDKSGHEVIFRAHV